METLLSENTYKAYPISCNQCNNRDATLLFTVQGRNLVKCRICGLVYVEPWIENPSMYTEDYFVARNRYLARQDEFRAEFQRLLRQIAARKAYGTLLDVGCGPGLLLDVARQEGWQPYGTDVSEWSTKYAREELGLPVVHGTLEDANYPQQHFDVVVINHVLEHVPDPTRVLKMVHDILKDDGLLVVGVPNIRSVLAWYNRERWPSLLVEQHRWHFSPNTLSKLLRKCSFDVEVIHTQDRKPWGGFFKRTALACLSVTTRLTQLGEAIIALACKA